MFLTATETGSGEFAEDPEGFSAFQNEEFVLSTRPAVGNFPVVS